MPQCNLPQTTRTEKSWKFSLISEKTPQHFPVMPGVGQAETKHETQKLFGKCWSQSSWRRLTLEEKSTGSLKSHSVMHCLTLQRYLLYTYPKQEQAYEMSCRCSENVLGEVLRYSWMETWFRMECLESSRTSVPITEAGIAFSFLVLWIAFCIQLLDQLEVLKSFSWKCILRLRSSMSFLKIISTYCDLGTGERVRQRSLGLFFPCGFLPIFSQCLWELCYFVRL